jgi:hypothetical protein
MKNGFWQRTYTDGCIGEIQKKFFGYVWRFYTPGEEDPIETGWNIKFVDAIFSCRFIWNRMNDANISKWKRLI